MQQYRLLRSNKETGPYTWQDLKDLPLKAYDLVWVEGKSAAWRYPSEIEEFKSFAPAVTEDLYIQFHTPPSGRHQEENAPARVMSVTKTPQKKYVSVILPSPVDKPVENKAPATVSDFNGWSGILKEPRAGSENIISTETISRSGKITDTLATVAAVDTVLPITAESSPLPEKYNRYYIALAVLILLAVGIYFGRNEIPLLNRYSDNGGSREQNMVILTGNESPANDEDVEWRKKVPELKSNPALDFAALKRYVSVQSGEFSVGFFGGISNLELRVTNTGKTTLDNIVIAVDFLKKDKSVTHTEMVTIKSLRANRTITETVSGNRQGIAIRTRIISINGLNAP
ncbi:hypothetical protein ACFSQD_04135 [Flavihumibacter stibioxidans]|uniref:GYF domain-containing protein n=1 Tax=Flavihumibacter stibioxidans TaxID=1834163 RepID=A0ABR7M3A0_9BACT|nr:hypothetical protein [Flavihumibacter stibioxidans]MBC6489496.1 hypothetical protein [Flavihumibacter stibioxidans]